MVLVGLDGEALARRREGEGGGDRPFHHAARQGDPAPPRAFGHAPVHGHGHRSDDAGKQRDPQVGGERPGLQAAGAVRQRQRPVHVQGAPSGVTDQCQQLRVAVRGALGRQFLDAEVRRRLPARPDIEVDADPDPVDDAHGVGVVGFGGDLRPDHGEPLATRGDERHLDRYLGGRRAPRRQVDRVAVERDPAHQLVPGAPRRCVETVPHDVGRGRIQADVLRSPGRVGDLHLPPDGGARMEMVDDVGERARIAAAADRCLEKADADRAPGVGGDQALAGRHTGRHAGHAGTQRDQQRQREGSSDPAMPPDVSPSRCSRRPEP